METRSVQSSGAHDSLVATIKAPSDDGDCCHTEALYRRIKVAAIKAPSMDGNPLASVEIGAIAAYERPLPTMAEYDQLFSITARPVQA